jgi:hypothetical protein
MMVRMSEPWRLIMPIQRIALINKGFATMSVQRILLTVIVLALPTLGYTQEAQAPPSAPAQAAPQTPEPTAPPGRPEPALAPIREPRALDRLKRMSATLGAAKALTYRSRSTVEVPANTGQFVTLFAASDVALQRPNKLYVHVTGEVPNFDFYYNGTTITAFAPQKQAYSVANAPATIDATLKFTMDKAGIQFPSADVMYSDPYAMLTKELTNAFVVGPATVDGVACEHLAFMGPGVHWETWIDTGKSALPRRLVVTYTEVQNFPRFLVEFSDWNLQPKLAASRFVFNKPRNATQIEFVSPTGQRAQ